MAKGDSSSSGGMMPRGTAWGFSSPYGQRMPNQNWWQRQLTPTNAGPSTPPTPPTSPSTSPPPTDTGASSTGQQQNPWFYQPIQNAYQQYLGRQASPQEMYSQMFGAGGRYYNPQGVNQIVSSIQTSPEAQAYARKQMGIPEPAPAPQRRWRGGARSREQ